MLTKIKLGFGALSVMMLVGCGAGQVDNGDLTADQDVESAKEDSARKKSHPEFYKCDVDADCVAIEKAGCCPNGFLVAVNKDEVKALRDQVRVHHAAGDLPALRRATTTRVAQCDFQAHTCQMIDPTQIRCGGFIDPSHACPDGFSCNFGGRVPDVGGSCVASAQ